MTSPASEHQGGREPSRYPARESDHAAKRHSFAVEAQVNGGGVVADEVTRTGMADGALYDDRRDSWLTGPASTRWLVLLANSVFTIPPQPPAVFNVAAYTASGYSAPAPFQGLSVGAHSQLEVNLGTQIVNTANIGVHVSYFAARS